jgi:hypothetical protein
MNATYAFLRRAVAASALLIIAATGAQPALAKKADSTWSGIVRHVSAENIKVYNPAQKKTIGFVLSPHFKNVFHHGSKTVQLATIAPGQYVKVLYDRHLLGLPHADTIYLMDNANDKLMKE